MQLGGLIARQRREVASVCDSIAIGGGRYTLLAAVLAIQGIAVAKVTREVMYMRCLIASGELPIVFGPFRA